MAQMNPYTTSREDFTNGLVNRPIPDDASSDWKAFAEPLRELLKKLGFHQAMMPNLQQTYMTPANSKNKVYFMWDFVGRTLGMLYNIPPSQSYNRRSEAWTDIVSRNGMSASLILDDKPGMLDMMVSSTYPGLPQETIRFDEETLELATKLKEGNRGR